MMKTLLTLFVLFFSFSAVSSRVLFYADYKNNTDKKTYIDHIMSVESGMSWMQIYNKKLGIDSIYCKPANLNVSIENLEDAINLSVRDFRNRGVSNNQIDGYTVEILLLFGLQILFPCD